jgi:hypothetical protein
MIRCRQRRNVIGVLASLLVTASTALAQTLPGRLDSPPGRLASSPHGALQGVVVDEHEKPMPGAVVSAIGSITLVAVADREGRFAFDGLAPGSYLLRAHLAGYAPARSRTVRVEPGSRQSFTLELGRQGPSPDEPVVLAAGVGAAPADPPAPADDGHDHGELAWRLRHTRRSVLKEAQHAVAELAAGESARTDPRWGLGRAVSSPARYATVLFADLALDGEINLLTTTSFNRPQDLFSMTAGAPRGIAYLALSAPSADGEWRMRGTVTQGDLASWMLAGSFARKAPSVHAYEAGLSYSMQRYMGGNGEALAAVRDGARNVGAVYAYDTWTVAPRVTLGYGVRYASYDYLTSPGLLSPTATVSLRPSLNDSLTLRATVSHLETAPGAEEFLPPAVGVSLPPERTFSHVSRESFRPERFDHVEVGVERQWPGDVVVGVRAFRQRVEDQIVTLFGQGSDVGHYRVGSAGDVDSAGWGVHVSRAVGARTRAAVDYMRLQARWHGVSPDRAALLPFGRSVLRDDEQVHDVTATVESVVSPTSTRLLVVYKLNTAFAAAAVDGTAPGLDSRFNVEVSQALPFLRVAGVRWEMLMAVSNLFNEESAAGSVYDELLVVRPPKRVLGGVTVRF